MNVKNLYNKLTIGKKILAGFLLVACVAGLSGIFSTGVIWDVNRRGALMYTTNLIPISDLTDAVNGYQASRYLLRDIIIDRSQQEQNEHLEKLKQADSKVSKSLASFIRSNHSAEAAKLHQQITEDLKLYDSFRQKVIELAMSDRRDEAVNIMRYTASDVIDRIDENIAKVVAINNAQALHRFTDNKSAARIALCMNLLCLLAGVMSALAMGWFISRGITGPLTLLTETVGAIAAGDLTARIGNSCPADSRNEIHILSGNIDRMTGTLQGVITRISDESRQLFTSSGTLNQTSELMAQRADSASEQIHSVSSSSEEMNLTASEIARNCSTAAAKVAMANNGLAESEQNMAETILSMKNIGEHVHETADLIARLGEKSIQIGEITATIDDIADQTNLLALNAAIEAARAGENGRGFAVVADEVRALAARTTVATKDISAMIKAIQNETRLAVTAMDQSVEEVEEGTRMVARTGDALISIANSVQSISAEVGQIATVAEQQSASVHGITTNIQQVTAIIRESTNGIQEFATAASGLNIIAGDLREIVGKFKLVQSMDKRTCVDEPAETLCVFPGLAAAEAMNA